MSELPGWFDALVLVLVLAGSILFQIKNGLPGGKQGGEY